MHFQVAVCWLPSDGGEQCDQSGLAVPHPAGVSAGSHHRSIEDSEHPLPPGPQVGTQTEETHTFISNILWIGLNFLKRIVQHLFSSTISTLDLTCLNRTITSQLVHLWVFLLLDVGQGYFVFGDSNFAHQLFSYWFLYIGIFFMHTSDLDTLRVFYII